LKDVFSNYEEKSLVEAGLVIESEGKRYDRFRDRVMFPILNARGAVIGFGGRVMGEGEPKYLNSPETPLFEKGREVYGLAQARDAIRNAGRVLVVEGYMDVVALAQFEVGYAVATLGTATSAVHVSKLLRLADELVFCFDGDAAGRKAAWRALEVSLPLAPDHKPIRFLFLPEGEDPDTYIRKNGKDAFEGRVRQAETLSQFLLAQLRAEADLATPEGRARFLSMAKPHVQRLTAPALRIQLVNAIAELGRVSEGEIAGLMQLSQPRYARPAPARVAHGAPDSPEWSLLVSALCNLSLAELIDPDSLTPNRPESAALLALRDACREFEDEPSLGLLLDSLQGNQSLEIVLRAHRYGEAIRFNPDEARAEFTEALGKLDLARRKKELDELRGRGLNSKADLMAFQEKNLAYKRLQGALPSP
jgi:DNA primase